MSLCGVCVCVWVKRASVERVQLLSVCVRALTLAAVLENDMLLVHGAGSRECHRGVVV